MRFATLLLALLAQDQPTFRSDVALVHADVEVRDEHGPVDGLTKENFRIADNGRLRNLVYFAHEEQPLDLILLFDVSSSMRPVVARVAEAAHKALGELREGDRIAVMAFDSKTVLVADFSGDFEAVETSIGEVLQSRFTGLTHIQGALGDSALHFVEQRRATARRAILIVTDDVGTKEQPDALRQLWNADAVVVGVIVGGTASHTMSIAHYVYMGMKNIALKTGGDSIDTGDAAEGLHEMIHRLRERYSLYYALPQGASGEERKIDVQLTREAAAQHPHAVVTARTGYIMP
jgi:VWFA-related protein